MSAIKEDELYKLLRKCWSEYYSQHLAEIKAPRECEKREFGFLFFRDDSMLRHRGFKSREDLVRFIEATAPSDVYYSAAYYDRPEESMELKGWKGADLIFDVDADHIETPCKDVHDSWLCLNCGCAGKGRVPLACTKCKSQRFKEKSWLCDKCLGAAKMEILKLIDMLTRDFGFSHSDMTVFFSGHRGYHIHVECEKVRQLDQQARKEIVDFVRGTGLNATFHGLYEEKIGAGKGGRIVVGPNLDEPGWRGRLSRGTRRLMMNLTENFLESLRLKDGTVNLLLKRKEALATAWDKVAAWGVIEGLDMSFWRKITESVIKQEAVSVDSIVTTDIHRLIRLPNTLHGKTGLKAVEAPIVGLEGFDPLLKAVAFDKGTLSVYVFNSLEFRLGDNVYGPYEEARVELPLAAAIYLLLRGSAELAG